MKKNKIKKISEPKPCKKVLPSQARLEFVNKHVLNQRPKSSNKKKQLLKLDRKNSTVSRKWVPDLWDSHEIPPLTPTLKKRQALQTSYRREEPVKNLKQFDVLNLSSYMQEVDEKI